MRFLLMSAGAASYRKYYTAHYPAIFGRAGRCIIVAKPKSVTARHDSFRSQRDTADARSGRQNLGNYGRVRRGHVGGLINEYRLVA
jgi:hypothetical protein